MSTADAKLEASYAACRRMVRRSQSNFGLSFLLLGRERRRAMEALYAFMRHTDDLGDSPEPAQQRRRALQAWRAELDAALTECRVHEVHPILPAVADAVRRYGIPPEHLRAVIDGQEMDLIKHRYETFEELVPYCECVASAVGLACIYIWGFRGAEATALARQCGIALQLVNILRDVKPDLAAGRVYLPQADLRRCGYTVEELGQGVVNEPFCRLVEFEAERAAEFYRHGVELLSCLAPEGRRCFGLIMATYGRLLAEIRRRPGEILRRRLTVGPWSKLRIGLRWLVWPPRSVSLP